MNQERRGQRPFNAYDLSTLFDALVAWESE